VPGRHLHVEDPRHLSPGLTADGTVLAVRRDEQALEVHVHVHPSQPVQEALSKGQRNSPWRSSFLASS
jgi:hypothetical protein